MNTSSTPEINTNTTSRPWVAGAILILIGVIFLAERFFHFPGLALLPGLALIFLAWALMTRSTGLLIPGGVLGGIGAAALLIEGPLAGVSEPAKGGVFFVTFAAGWLLITLLSPLTQPDRRFMLWPLWPAGGMIVFGGLLLAGETGIKALDLFGQAWPVALIVIGLFLALRRRDLKS